MNSSEAFGFCYFYQKFYLLGYLSQWQWQHFVYRKYECCETTEKSVRNKLCANKWRMSSQYDNVCYCNHMLLHNADYISISFNAYFFCHHFHCATFHIKCEEIDIMLFGSGSPHVCVCVIHCAWVCVCVCECVSCNILGYISLHSLYQILIRDT